MDQIRDLIESVSEGFPPTLLIFVIFYSLQCKIEGHVVKKRVLIQKGQREFLCAKI